MPNFSSLYLHFPFCESKCHYCDFYSIGRERTREGDPDQFIQALRKETELRVPSFAQEIDTIFMGGGTPSMTPPDDMAFALEPLLSSSRLGPGGEWTMEANPSSVDTGRLKQYRALGVNRISMGVQSMNDELLLRLGRVHSREKALESLDAIFAAGLQNVSVDLICGVPGQTLHDLESALASLTAFPITHLSCYLLTLPKHHAMYKDLPKDDIQLQHLLKIHDWMTARGFEHYEISNFAKPGKRARHNLAYWKGASYLGLGPSAHSFDRSSQRRWKNVSSLHKYSELLQGGTIPQDTEEFLSPAQLELEKWMLALRLDEGFPVTWLETPAQKNRASQLEKEGYLEPHPVEPLKIRLTPRGFAVSDSIIQALSP